MASTYNIEVNEGNTWLGLQVTIKVNGVILDLTAATVEFRITNTAGVAPVQLAVGTGITVTTPASGVAVINKILLTLARGVYAYSMRVTTATYGVQTILSGAFSVKGLAWGT